MNVLKTTIAHIASELDVFTSSDVPSKRPESFVTVERAGGERTRIDDRATLTVQVWHRDRLALEALEESVVGTLLAMPDAIDGVYSVEVQDSYYPEQGVQTWPRYVLTCSVYCRS